MLSELSLDIRTLAFVATLSAVMQAILLAVLWRAVPRSAATAVWAAGGALLALGFILLAFRHLLPDVLSIVVANLAIAGAHALYLLGIERYCGRRSSTAFVVAVLAATLGFFVVFGLVVPDTGVRIVVISIALLALSFVSAWRLWQRDRAVRSPIDLLVAALLATHGVFHSLRGGYTFLVERGIQDFMAASTIHAFAFIDVIIFCFASGVGFAVLTISALHRALEKELQDKNRLFSVLAHDLRSPFGGLVGLADLIAIAFSKKQYDRIEDLAGQGSLNAKEVLALLDDLLIWGRAEFKGEKSPAEPIDLDGLTTSVLSLQSKVADEKGITITRDLNVKTAFGVRAHAEVVLRNLISNALKFSSGGAEIIIRSHAQEGRVILSVSDRGIGLADKSKAAAVAGDFNSRAGTAGEKGAGLGLSLCSDLCAGDGQDLWLAENPAGGTIASFTLDAWNPGDHINPAAGAQAAA